MTTNNQNKKTFLKDYLPPAFLVKEVALQFELDETDTAVMSRFTFQFNPAFAKASGAAVADTEMVLDGESLELDELYLDGKKLLEGDDYRLTGTSLTILKPPVSGEIICLTRINPKANTALEGLYRSGPMYCTQCEADGFRRITYFPDRPDVMSKYSTKIIADKDKNPILLSNGNRTGSGDLGNGKHWVEWQDPFPKPSYLFALVAGDLTLIEDSFTTQSGRDVAIHFYVEPESADKCAHAVASLKNSMAWDEQAYGREYDLDIYMVVAVSHFNMGAMENKGLNVFNSKFVLASPQTATDDDYEGIEAVIGHEYFHNWSGNRVTCRDWFQLSLKEGFTVLREQQFSAAMGSAGVKRIADVRRLRAFQFPEDAGPTAHAVRPESYIETNNLYTATVYEKGAEVVRMIMQLVGEQGFRKGCDLYFDRHDGQAVCTEDFVKAQEDANDIDLGQFSRWYQQAGTPRLQCRGEYHAETQQYQLHFIQSCPPTPEQPEKQPFVIPVKISLLSNGGAVLLDETVLTVTEAQQSFNFDNITEAPVPALLKGFTAPVELIDDLSTEQRLVLLQHETDGFVRWDSAQKLAEQEFMCLLEDEEAEVSAEFIQTVKQLLTTAEDKNTDLALLAELLTFPELRYWVDRLDTVDIDRLSAADTRFTQALASQLQEQWRAVYQQVKNQSTTGSRCLTALCLRYLLSVAEPLNDDISIALAHHLKADNMTDSLAGLKPLVNAQTAQGMDALDQFYRRWKHELLVVDKWLALQAAVPVGETVNMAEQLLEHPAFSLDNPNKLRSLIGIFAQANPVAFHREDGAGYRLVADQILRLNEVNPQVAARLVQAFNRWKKIEGKRSSLMKQQLDRIMAEPNLARPIYDIVSRALA